MLYDFETHRLFNGEDSIHNDTGVKLAICARLFQSGLRKEADNLWLTLQSETGVGGDASDEIECTGSPVSTVVWSAIHDTPDKEAHPPPHIKPEEFSPRLRPPETSPHQQANHPT